MFRESMGTEESHGSWFWIMLKPASGEVHLNVSMSVNIKDALLH